MDNFQQKSFLAYVNFSDAMPVAREMVGFLSDFDSFLNYQRPESVVDAKKISASREDLIQSFALHEVVSKRSTDPLFEISEQERETFAETYVEQSIKAIALRDLPILKQDSLQLEQDEIASESELEAWLTYQVEKHEIGLENLESVRAIMLNPLVGGGLAKCQAVRQIQSTLVAVSTRKQNTLY